MNSNSDSDRKALVERLTLLADKADGRADYWERNVLHDAIAALSTPPTASSRDSVIEECAERCERFAEEIRMLCAPYPGMERDVCRACGAIVRQLASPSSTVEG